MKAIVQNGYGSPDVLTLEVVDRPTVPIPVIADTHSDLIPDT